MISVEIETILLSVSGSATKVTLTVIKMSSELLIAEPSNIEMSRRNEPEIVDIFSSNPRSEMRRNEAVSDTVTLC